MCLSIDILFPLYLYLLDEFKVVIKVFDVLYLHENTVLLLLFELLVSGREEVFLVLLRASSSP
jgi:hypothetical protein